MAFTVPALPDRKFAAKISRVSHSLDQATRQAMRWKYLAHCSKAIASLRVPLMNCEREYKVNVQAAAALTK